MSTLLKRWIALSMVLCLLAAALPSLSVFAASTQPLNVMDYGAVGDGVTGDHEAIQAAIDAAAEGAGGGVVTFPAGTYLADDFIILKSNITLQLDDEATIVNGINYSVGPCVVFLTGPYTRGEAKKTWTGVENVTVIGGTIDMNGELNGSGTAAKNLPLVGSSGAFALGYSKNVRIENVTFLNNYRGHTIRICACDGVTITGCSFEGQSFPVAASESVKNNAETIQIVPSSVNSFPFAANDTGAAAQNITIEDCYFGASEKCGALSVAIGNHNLVDGYQKCNSIRVLNNTFVNMSSVGVRLYGYEDVTVQGNTFTGGNQGIEAESCSGSMTMSGNAFSGLASQNVRLVACGDNGTIYFDTHGAGSIDVSTASDTYTFTAVADESGSFKGYYEQDALTNLVTTSATVTFPVSQSTKVERHALFETCNHVYTSSKTAATCTKDGSITYTCTSCGDSYTEVIQATGHDYSSVTTAPGCTSNGGTTYTCKNCGHSYTDVVQATGHDYTSVTTAPGCTSNGGTTYTCKNCGHSYTNVVQATGHDYTSVTTAPTCTANGGTTYTCKTCGDSYTDVVQATGHSYADGVCTTCGAKDPNYTLDYYLIGYINGADYGCEGDYENLGIYKFVNGKLTVTFECPSYVFVKTGDNQNWYMSEGYCQESTVTLYNTTAKLTDPNKLFVPGGVEVTFTLTVNKNGTLTLSYVKGVCEHAYSDVVTTPTCTVDGYTTHTCTKCGESYVDSIVLAMGHDYVNGVCSDCGNVVTDDETPVGNLFTLSGANTVLGGELDMNFFVDINNLTGTDYYAQITLYAEDGTVTSTIPYADWEVRTNYLVVTQKGLAARQMADKMEVVIYHGNGIQASVLWSDSIRDYAMRIIEKQGAKAKTLLVDMLNYGAGAQEYFGYNTDDLANSLLTETQKGYATQSVSSVDQRVKGTGYYGSTLTLKNRILLTMYFNNITPDMYAVVSFTDHKGYDHETRVEGSAFSQYNSSVYGVVVDELVVADGDQFVTVTVYDENGNAVATASDTVNSYAVRQTGGDPLFELVEKFTAAAYAYFH